MNSTIAIDIISKLPDSQMECIHNLLDMEDEESCIEYIIYILGTLWSRDDAVDLMNVIITLRDIK